MVRLSFCIHANVIYPYCYEPKNYLLKYLIIKLLTIIFCALRSWGFYDIPTFIVA